MKSSKKKKKSPGIIEPKQGSFFPPIQTKLAIGKADDAYEKEADATADKVVKGVSGGASLQKKGEEEEILQQKPLANDISTVQKKKMPADEEPIQKKGKPVEEEPIQKQEEEEEPIQKEEEEEEEAIQQKEEEEETLQKKSAQNQSASPQAVEAKLKQQKGKGSKMHTATKNEMEHGFGANFSNVTIHNDTAAEDLSNTLGAQAFTHGNDVYFNKGKYNPNSKEGKHLLAHELTHTIQQKKSDKNIQKDPKPSGGTINTGFDRLKELREIHKNGHLTAAQETEFIKVLNPLINTISLPQIGNPKVIASPDNDKFQPKQVYFETATRYHLGRPAVTKSGVYENGEIQFNKGMTNIQSDACIIIGPAIVKDTLDHTLSLLEHEGVHVYQTYQNIEGSDADHETMGYTRQFKRFFAFSEFEIKNLLYQWSKEYVDADPAVQDHSNSLINSYLPQTASNEGIEKVLRVIPNVLDEENSKRISPKKEARIKALLLWLEALLQTLKT